MEFKIMPDPPKRTGKHWKGGKYVSNHGYMLIYKPKHHRANSRGYVLEHVLVAELKYGREISNTEDVHHVDENKLNNHPDNLIVLSPSEHMRLHRLNGKEIECKKCEKLFYKNQYEIDKYTRHYCSKECYTMDNQLLDKTDDEWIEIFKNTTVSEFARKHNLKRTTVQDKKNKLMKKGLIEKCFSKSS